MAMTNSAKIPSDQRVAHRHHHLSLNRKGRWGTTDDFTTSFLHLTLFFAVLWDLANSRSVHSLMLCSHFFLCLVTFIFLYVCESLTLTEELQRKIQAMEMRCYRKILRVLYKIDHVTNDEVCAKIQ